MTERITGRSFPSIFQAWNPADNLKEDRTVTEARHDLIFNGASFFRLQWNNDVHHGLATGFTEKSIQQGLRRRQDLMSRNPNMILLIEIRYRDAHKSYLPDGHKWWRRDGKGQIVQGWEEGGYLQLDYSNPEFREQVAIQARAAIQSGVVDGIMLDWWDDDTDRLALAKAIRKIIGDKGLILANANDRHTPETASFINGYFMECYRSRTAEDWKRIADTLAWAEKNLRVPRINCLETWYHKSRADENLLRATTTLSLVLSDGYCLFSDPNPLPTPDHLHNWYPFWERRLGPALAQGIQRPDGSITRDFANGTAVYNPMGNNSVNISFSESRTSIATGKNQQSHALNSCDGDIYIK
ncbi:MAG: hypothetical protein A2283_20110 [Lentisphaerae bacterium RIFOXYA12_FULL_48_11]|nr:MAG: hypothetical protein A2283_20110 [Lentisphaerae bacterium RIFOXYA12_FULL_48_11]